MSNIWNSNFNSSFQILVRSFICTLSQLKHCHLTSCSEIKCKKVSRMFLTLQDTSSWNMQYTGRASNYWRKYKIVKRLRACISFGYAKSFLRTFDFLLQWPLRGGTKTETWKRGWNSSQEEPRIIVLVPWGR